MRNHGIVQIGGRRRRVRNSARIFVDGHDLGEVVSPDSLTPPMLAHGVTGDDVARILSGVRHHIHFRCAGRVEIRTGRSLDAHRARQQGGAKAVVEAFCNSEAG